MQRIMIVFWVVSLIMVSGMTDVSGANVFSSGFNPYYYFYPDAVIGQNGFFQNTSNRVDGRGLDEPRGIAIDKSVTPNHLYIADSYNNRILGWGNIDHAFLGNEADIVIGQNDLYSNWSHDGNVSPLSLYEPHGLWVGNSGDLYVCDFGNNRVLFFHDPFQDDNAADGLLGQNSFGESDPNGGGSVSSSVFDHPIYLAVDDSLGIYVSDYYNNRVLFFQNPFETGGDGFADAVVGQPDFTSFFPNRDAASPADNTLYFPAGLAFDSLGNLWLTDSFNYRILRYPTPLPTTGGQANWWRGQPSFGTNYYNWDGITMQSNFSPYPTGLDDPRGILLDAADRLYIADQVNSRVLRWDDPTSTALAADFVFGHYGDFYRGDSNHSGVPTPNTLSYPHDVDMDSQGRLYIVDSTNNRVLRYDNPLGSSTAIGVCGQPDLSSGEPNYLDGAGLSYPVDVAIDKSSTPEHVYIVDRSNNRVLCWNNLDDALMGLPADIVLGQPDPYSNDPGCSQERLDDPSAIAVDSLSHVWIADEMNNRVIGFENPFVHDQKADFLIGQPSWTSSNSNMGFANPTSATLSSPEGICFDASGSLWVADSMNNRALRFSEPYNMKPDADLVLGQQDMTTSIPNYFSLGPKSLNYPTDVAGNEEGNLFVCDSGNNRVLEFLYPQTGGGADRVFGQLDDFYTNDADAGGTISARGLNNPVCLAIYDNDILAVTDQMNSRVLGFFDAASPSGDTTADFVFGQNGQMNTGGYETSGDPSPTSFNFPRGIAFDPYKNLFVADSDNNRVLVFQVPLPPKIRAAAFIDADNNSLVDFGDRLILQFPEAMAITPGADFVATDFHLPRAGDSLGIGFEVRISTLKKNSLIITLGVSPSLRIEGSDADSSRIDVAPEAGEKLVSLLTGMPVVSSSPLDIKFVLRSPPPQNFGPGGGTLQILDDPDALFRKHQLYLPPGVDNTSFLFSILPPQLQLPYLTAVKIYGASEAYITLEFSPESVGEENGFMLKYMRMALLVQDSGGNWVPVWRSVPFVLDLTDNTITTLLGDLYENGGGAKIPSMKYGIDGDVIIVDARNLVEENSVNAQEESGGGLFKRKMRNPGSVCLSPGTDCIYTKHKLCIPGYEEIPSGGYTLTIRQATADEREEFPDQSGAVFVIESDPEFPFDAAFDLTVEYVPNEDPDLTDVLTLEGAPGSEGKLRLVKRDPSTGEFAFVSSYGSVTLNENNTLTTTGLFELTDGGTAVYGLAVDPTATSLTTAASVWEFYE